MSDRLLRAALRMYPRDRRARDGQVLLDCARDLGGGPREAVGLVFGGLTARFGGRRVTQALPGLALPLAAVLLALCTAGLRDAVAGSPPGFLGWFWILFYGSALAAAVAAALGRRWLAIVGALGLLALAAAGSLIPYLANQGSRFTASLGIWSVDVLPAALPALALLLAAACAPPVRRPLRHLIVPPLAVAAGWAVSTPVLVAGAVALGPVAAVAGAWRGGLAASRGALTLAVTAPETIWLATGILPHETREALPAVGVMAASAALAVAGVALTARRARAMR